MDAIKARIRMQEKLLRETRVTIEALRGHMSQLLYSDESPECIDGEKLVDAASSLSSLVCISGTALPGCAIRGMTMGAEYDAAARWRAMELYCADRLTFAQVAEATGVADSTLRRWADAYQWRERREELARAEVDIRIDTIRSRAAILRHLIEAQDGKAASQIAFAVSSLGNLALQREKALLAGEIANPAKPEKPVKVSSRAEAIAVLKQAVEDKLGLLLSDKKYVTSDSVTDIAKCLALVQELEATLPKEEADSKKHGGVSADIAERLDKALGLVK